MTALRVLLSKDVRILRRSPLLVGVMVAYAIVIGLPVGFAVSRPPSKPRVAFLNEVPPGKSSFNLGGKQLDAAGYADRLFDAVDPIRVRTRAQAIKKVKSGQALGALIIPRDATQKLQSALSLSGSAALPTLQVLFNGDNPLKRTYVDDTISAQVAKANAALSEQLTKVAGSYLNVLLRGGKFSFLGQNVQILGLQASTKVLAAAERSLRPGDPQRAAIEQVRRFAQLAVDNLDLSGPVLGAISQPIRVKATTIDGPQSSLDGYAIAAAVSIAVMFVGLLVAAGMLALEREEHAYGRLVRGLVSRTGLIAEKTVLGGACAIVVGLLLIALLAIFRSIAWGRSELIALALVLGALAFGGLGVAVGAIARDVRAASLLAFLLSLPIAALALVPSGTVDDTLYDVIRTVSVAFPFKATLQGLDTALNSSGPSLVGPLANLVALVLVYAAAARFALRRFG